MFERYTPMGHEFNDWNEPIKHFDVFADSSELLILLDSYVL